MDRIVCYVSLVLVVCFIHSSFGQGNVFSANRQAAPRRAIVPRPATTTMSPEHLRVAMRNKAMAVSSSSTSAQGSISNNAGGNAASSSGNNANSNMASASSGGQSRNSNQRGGNRWQRGNNNRQRPMMICPHQMPSDCPEIQPKPGCFSQNIMSWMGRPCRGCPFDMCERSGYNPMDMAKKMAKMGMNPMQFMNQMNPMGGMGGMHPAMYNSNFFENMPSWMRFMWGNNAFSGFGNSGGGGGGGGGGGNNGGGSGNNVGGGGGNNQGGGGGSQSQNTNNNQGSVTTTMSPWLWHSLMTK